MPSNTVAGVRAMVKEYIAKNYGKDVVAISNSLPRMTSGGVLTNNVQFGWQYGTIVWQVPIGWGGSTTARATTKKQGFCRLRKRSRW